MAWFIMRKGSRFLFSNDFGYVCLDRMLGRTGASRVSSLGVSLYLDNKVNDYVFRPKELENINLYDFIADFDVKQLSNKSGSDIFPFLDEHPQSKFRGVLNRIQQITPLVSYLDFPDSADFEGDILDPTMQPTPATEQYAKSVLCLFVPFRDDILFTNPPGSVSYTHQLRALTDSNEIDETTRRRLQNIQDCRNMMKSGRQKDSLERNTQPLPDPVKGTNNDDHETDEDVAKHIDECLTELVSQLDEDNNLERVSNDDGANQLSFMSLNELRGKGKDECGYTCIKPPAVDETNSSVYQFATDIATNIRTESSRFAATFSPGILSKKNSRHFRFSQLRETLNR